MNPLTVYTFVLPLFLFFLRVQAKCSTDEDCSLNGICTSNVTNNGCVCDPSWIGTDCGVLDVQPVERWTGYNHTNATGPGFLESGNGNSSWGGHIIQDPSNKKLFHMIVAQFADGCGLSHWRPYSVIIRAESQTGPRGPFIWKEQLFGTFHHNPTTIWSPADQKYLIYFIGKDVSVSTTSCVTQSFNNVISVSSSPDLKTWATPQVLISKTNPAPWPLWSATNQTSAMLLGIETNNIYYAPTYSSTYTLEVTPNNVNKTEDPFLWRDKRGHWHIINHDLIDYYQYNRRYPRVGSHAFARNWEGPWTLSNTIAYTTEVQFTDGSTTNYGRRERPKLYFSDDGNMTPLYLVNGVIEMNAKGSYTLIQPLGTDWKNYEKQLGF